MATEKRRKHKGGRKPKIDPCKHRYAISLNDVDNARFLSLFEASGMDVKAHFITATLFEKPINVVKIDKGTVDYYMRPIGPQVRFNFFKYIKKKYIHMYKCRVNIFVF